MAKVNIVKVVKLSKIGVWGRAPPPCPDAALFTKEMAKVNIVKIVKIVQNWCLGQGSPLPCSCYRPAAGATLQGLCRKGYADDDADDDKDDDDDGDDMMLLIYSLKVVGAQRGSVLN